MSSGTLYNFRECGVLIDKSDQPIYWHVPDDRSAVSLPDSRKLWEVIWWNREIINGFAHTHPGHGTPYPSDEDLSTFDAIDNGIGRRLFWWIATEDGLMVCQRVNPGILLVTSKEHIESYSNLNWLQNLRDLSKGVNNGR